MPVHGDNRVQAFNRSVISAYKEHALMDNVNDSRYICPGQKLLMLGVVDGRIAANN